MFPPQQWQSEPLPDEADYRLTMFLQKPSVQRAAGRARLAWLRPRRSVNWFPENVPLDLNRVKMQKSQPAGLQSALEELHDVAHLPASWPSALLLLLLLLLLPRREAKLLCFVEGVNDFLKAIKRHYRRSFSIWLQSYDRGAGEVFIAWRQFDFLELLPSKRRHGGR